MSITPAGYEAFHSKRRRSITFLCFLISISLISGLLIYIDSYSIHKWNEFTDIGPVAFYVSGTGAYPTFRQNVRNVQGVTHTCDVPIAYAHFNRSDIEYGNYYSGYIFAPSDDGFDYFASIYKFTMGRFPKNNSEIAVSSSLIDYLNLTIGDTVEFEISGFTVEHRKMTIVGIYDINTESNDAYSPVDFEYLYGVALVNNSYVDIRFSEFRIFIDVDRSFISPSSPQSSIDYLKRIKQDIQELDPFYSPNYSSTQIYVQTFLLDQIYSFIYWKDATSSSELWRSSGVLLLAGLLIFLAVRYNMNDRKYESQMLISRGASLGTINGIANREFFALSIAATILSFLVGSIFSRIAIASTGFLELDLEMMITEPLLISISTLYYIPIIGIVMTMIIALFHHSFFSVITPKERRRGTLSKLTWFLRLIKWDVLVLILSIVLIWFILSAGPISYTYPILSLALNLAPLTLFLSMASLSIKFLRKTAELMSKHLTRFFGAVQSRVGIRRIGKSASSAGPVIVVLVLSISTAWTFSVVNSSLPITKLNHARFSLGGDVSLQIVSDNSSMDQMLLENLTSHPLIEAATIVQIQQMQLSTSSYTGYDFAAIDPVRFANVSYDFRGRQLNSTSVNDILKELAINPSGAIITESIAREYDLAKGDILRSFADIDGTQIAVSFNIIDIEYALTNCRALSSVFDFSPWYYYDKIIGTDVIWVNGQYLLEQLNQTELEFRVLVSRAKANANSTRIVEDFLNSGAWQFINTDELNSVDNELSRYVNSVDFRISRSVDSMLMFGTILITAASFLVYATEGVYSRRREIALMRSQGADRMIIIKTQIAELSVILILSTVFLLIYGPLLFTIAINMTRVTFYQFPIPIFVVYPILSMIEIYLIFVVSILLFIVLISIWSSRINLAESLNANWAEASPFGGE